MASYAAIASKPGVPVVDNVVKATEDKHVGLEKEVMDWMSRMSEVTTGPDSLLRLMEVLRHEMEMPAGVPGFRGSSSSTASPSHRNFGGGGSSGPTTNWRSGFNNPRFGSSAFDTRGSFDTKGSFDAKASFDPKGSSRGFHDASASASASAGESKRNPSSEDSVRPRPAVGRYQSRFKSSDNIQDKILNTVIGNKLNAFTPSTYNDTRDFIYQIIDSGEQEFTRDFIEKVFVKAVVEDLYCALFAKLIAEIAHRYPVIYEEMNKYHKEFLKIFDSVKEDSDADYQDLVKEKQYRMGYGQFIAELAGLNALEKSHLMTMVSVIIDKIYIYSAEENKVKTVEEFIDCIVRLSKGLQTRSPTFFKDVKGSLSEIVMAKLEEIIARSTPRPSLSNKARFGLMDLKDIINR